MSEHRHATDRVDVTFIAECPTDPDHLSVVIELEHALEDSADDVLDEFWLDECPECGAELQAIQQREPSEVLD